MREYEVDRLVEALTGLAATHELDAAHAAEFIPEGVEVPIAVAHALSSAISSGAAIGLREAISLIRRGAPR